MISVIITVDPGVEKHLQRALDSARWQLEEGDELIVVCDGLTSVTGTVNITPCRGISYARNAGVAETKGDWIKFLDGDDVLAPFALNVVRGIDGPKVVFGQQATVHNGKVSMQIIPDASLEKNLVAKGIVFHNPMRHIKQMNPGLISNSFIRRDALQEVGGFDERIAFEEDWDLWLKLHKKYGFSGFGYSMAPVCYYWIDDKERAAKVRDHTVEGMDVREYFRKTYGCDPK